MNIQNLLTVSEGFRRLSLILGFCVGVFFFLQGHSDIARVKESYHLGCFNIEEPDAQICRGKCINALSRQPGILTKTEEILVCEESCTNLHHNIARVCAEELFDKYYFKNIIFFPIVSLFGSIAAFRILVNIFAWLIDGFKKQK